MERTFTFKQDGKVEGDIVTFTISAKIGDEASRPLLYIPITQNTDGSEEIS